MMRTMGGTGNLVGLKALKWQALHGSFAKRLAIRTLIFATAISMLPLMQLVYDVDPTRPFFLSSSGCDSDMGLLGSDSLLGRVVKPVTPISFPHLRSGICMENVNLTIDVATELMSKNLLSNDTKALCIGKGSSDAVFALREMGLSDVDVIHRHPFFTLKQKQFVSELEFDDNSFGFVITRDLNKVTVPALLVNEVERILAPGGVAAVLVGVEGTGHDSLIRSATSVSSFLKSSNVVHLGSLGTFTFVAFKKRGDKLGTFDEYNLPKICPSITRSKPFMDKIEPIVEGKLIGHGQKVAYLPQFVDVPLKGKLLYIDMGAKQDANFSGGNWFLPSYPIDSRAFSVYIVDHDALVLSSHVKSPGVTFIYHPALAENVVGKDEMNIACEEPLIGEEEFDFLVWFKETVEVADFVVLKMNVGKPEMKFLSELFETGIICHVDELFLHCPEPEYNGGSRIDIFKSLRNVGVVAHQWWGN